MDAPPESAQSIERALLPFAKGGTDTIDGTPQAELWLGAHPAAPSEVWLEGQWVSLPPVEARLMAALLERMGAVVSREQLAKSGWPRGAPGRNALDVHMLRLRRRIAPVGLAIKTVRSRGYLLEADAAAALASS